MPRTNTKRALRTVKSSIPAEAYEVEVSEVNAKTNQRARMPVAPARTLVSEISEPKVGEIS